MIAGTIGLSSPALAQASPVQTVKSIATQDSLNIATGLLLSIRSGLPDGYLHVPSQTAGVFVALNSVKQIVKADCVTKGMNPLATFDTGYGDVLLVHTWSQVDWDQFVATEESLLPTVQPLVGLAGAPQNQGTKFWLGKIAAALGLSDIVKSLFEVLMKNWPDLLPSIGRAIAQKSWAWLEELFLTLPEKLLTQAFLGALIIKIGAKAAAKVVGTILGEMVPMVGWAIIIAQLIWGVSEEFIKITA